MKNKEFYRRLVNALYTELVNELIKERKKISTMESCTGGEIASQITNLPGSSAIYEGGLITYSTEVKNKIGGVSKKITDEYGDYTKVTAEEMSKRISELLNANYGIGITGKLWKDDPNNSGGKQNEVHISIYDKENYKHYTKTVEVLSGVDREENKIQIAYETAIMSLQVIKNMQDIEVVFASNNIDKLLEVKIILEPLGIKVLSLKDVEVDIDPEEIGSTFAENATIKAKETYEAIYQKLGKSIPVIADDSGLSIIALNNFPGVNTKRFAPGTEEDRNNILLRLLKKHSNRQANVITAIAYYDGKDSFVIKDSLLGIISNEPLGTNGFGYDPIFIPLINNPDHLTFSQMSQKQKNATSPRGSALEKSSNSIILTLTINKGLSK